MAKQSSCCQACSVMQWVVAALLFLGTTASIIGAWRAHFPETGAVFGSTSGSLSLIALAITSTLWLKSMKGCCTCSV